MPRTMTANHSPRLLWSGAARVVAIVALASLAACAHPLRAAAKPSDPSGIYERSTHTLSRPPAQAAACIAEHARANGHTPETVPLYGMESVAVMVKTSVAGDVLAVLSLTRSDAGAVAATTTYTGALKDRANFLGALVQGC